MLGLAVGDRDRDVEHAQDPHDGPLQDVLRPVPPLLEQLPAAVALALGQRLDDLG